MVVGRDDFDVNVRHIVHSRDPVVVEIGLFDRTVPNADFLGQSQTKSEHDATLHLLDNVAGLHRDAAVNGGPKIVNLDPAGGAVNRNFRHAAEKRIVIVGEGAA